MDYSSLLDAYIKKSGLSLAAIAERMKEKGVKVDRTYLSKLRNNPKYAASEEINKALAEVTGGDPSRLVWAGLIHGSHPSVRDILMLIDDEVVMKALKIIDKYPEYFKMSDEEAESMSHYPEIEDFWNSLAKHYKGVDSNYDPNAPFQVVPKIEPAGKFIEVPILGYVQAGLPIEMIENIEGYTHVEASVLHGRPGFALRVKGNSMIGDRIQEGDVVIVAKQPEVHPHEIAVVAVNGNHATLKRVKIFEDKCMLIPSNPTMEPQLVPAKDVHILGKVVEVKFTPTGR